MQRKVIPLSSGIKALWDYVEELTERIDELERRIAVVEDPPRPN